jgi:TRAP-type C4-dicarboxylate transport system permease small subunit
MMKFEQALGVVALGLLSWGSLQLYQMNANMTLVTYKVEENYKMIKPMWQDFLVRSDQVRVSAD